MQLHCLGSAQTCSIRRQTPARQAAARPTAAAAAAGARGFLASSTPHGSSRPFTPPALPTTTISSNRRNRPAPARDVSARALLEPSQALGVALFFTPGLLGLVYAFFKGKGNVRDGLSRMLTEFSQGYFQPDVGGKNIPVAQGELSDLAGDEPLFKALYQW